MTLSRDSDQPQPPTRSGPRTPRPAQRSWPSCPPGAPRPGRRQARRAGKRGHSRPALPRSGARGHRGVPPGLRGPARRGSAGEEGGAGAARGGATPSPRAVSPATYPRRRQRRPRSGSRARWLGIMGMARPSSGGGARPGRTPARESAPTCTASARARTRKARGRSARGSSEAATAPAGLRGCAATLLVLPPGAWRNARRRERAQPRGAGGRARRQVGHGEGRGRGEQEGGGTLARTFFNCFMLVQIQRPPRSWHLLTVALRILKAAEVYFLAWGLFAPS